MNWLFIMAIVSVLAFVFNKMKQESPEKYFSYIREGWEASNTWLADQEATGLPPQKWGLLSKTEGHLSVYVALIESPALAHHKAWAFKSFGEAACIHYYNTSQKIVTDGIEMEARCLDIFKQFNPGLEELRKKVRKSIGISHEDEQIDGILKIKASVRQACRERQL